jgi:hypothetical protein
VAPGLAAVAASAAFWPPHHLDLTSAWYGHVPFAYWLIETWRPACVVELGTHCGLSYLNFCEAIDRLGLPSRAYAIDTWEGDEHAGFYDAGVFQALTDIHDRRFSRFSRLVRSTFDDACPQFADGSIDLLHIDGLHSYDAVAHDFATWLPKLTSRAIVLFHDTNVRERGFGVWKLWQELSGRYPHFEMLHGHGLGVLGIGDDFPPPLATLFDPGAESEAPRAAMRALFARLGQDVIREAEALRAQGHLAAAIRERDQRIAGYASQTAARDGEIEALQAAIGARDGEIAALQAARDTDRERQARQLGDLRDEIARLRQQATDEAAAAQTLADRLTTAETRLESVKQSLSWRLTRIFRWPFPEAKRRRRRPPA